MLRIVMIKVTDKQIAEEFGTTVQTLNNWKNGDIQLKKRYHALKNALIESDMIIWEVTINDDKTDYVNNCMIGIYSIENRNNIVSMKIMR